MKKLLTLTILIAAATFAKAQDLKANLATAKSSYSSGKLEDAHFALQQSLQELDITIGKEVLKLLPPKLDVLASDTKDDNVTANISFVGATIHRSYSNADKKATIEIVNNSPLLGTLNAFLTSPLLASLGSNGNSKVVKIQGYKSRLTKEEGSEGSKPSYRLEIPFSNALVTMTVNNTNENEMLAFANTLPLEKIAKLIQ